MTWGIFFKWLLHHISFNLRQRRGQLVYLVFTRNKLLSCRLLQSQFGKIFNFSKSLMSSQFILKFVCWTSTFQLKLTLQQSAGQQFFPCDLYIWEPLTMKVALMFKFIESNCPEKNLYATLGIMQHKIHYQTISFT